MNIGQVALAVRKLLQHIHTVGIHMAAVLERIKVTGIGALPGQDHLVGVVGIAQLHISSEGGRIGDPHGAVAVTTLHAVRVDTLGLVDVRQPCLRHTNGHGVGSVIIANGELAGILVPCRDLICASGIPEELNDHIASVVANPLTQRVRKGISSQTGSLGGNGGQCTDDLIVYHIAHGSGGSMCIAIRNVGQTAGILAGAVFILPDGFFQCGIAGLILRVHSHIVVPIFAVHGGHGQRHEEGVAGADNILRHTGLHHQIQPLLQTTDLAVSVCVRLGHGLAAVPDGNLQRIFNGSGVGSQSIRQGLVQLVGCKVEHAVPAFVSVRLSQSNGPEHCVVRKSVQHTHLVLTALPLAVSGDGRHPQIGELHALDGVLRQLVGNGIVLHTGADIGRRIPRSVCAGCRDVVLVKGKGRLSLGVNGRRRERRGDKPQGHDHSQEQRPKSLRFLHSSVLLFMQDFLQK